MRRIRLEEIEQYYKTNTYKELYEKVLMLMQEEKIKPIKASGINGKKPALYKEFRILEKKEDNTSHIEELLYFFVPSISTNYYFNHISQYKEDREWLLLLNQYLKTSREELQIPMSINERSFAIWHREKFIKEEQGKKILKRCGLSAEYLNVYETVEPLAYYSQTKETPQNILIIENKDTFYSMRRFLMSGSGELLGKKIGTLIYGAGKGIIRSFQDFSLCAEPYMKEKDNKIYYFGDLDYEGILIYENLYQAYEAECIIEPFVEGYLKMLQRADEIGVHQMPMMKEGQNKNIGVIFKQYLGEKQFARIHRLLEQGRYIPQEILAIKDFRAD